VQPATPLGTGRGRRDRAPEQQAVEVRDVGTRRLFAGREIWRWAGVVSHGDAPAGPHPGEQFQKGPFAFPVDNVARGRARSS
jgi:hypothetical protein